METKELLSFFIHIYPYCILCLSQSQKNRVDIEFSDDIKGYPSYWLKRSRQSNFSLGAVLIGSTFEGRMNSCQWLL